MLDHTEIGPRLREAREAKGWTQSDLARASGVNQATISYIESGQKHVNSGVLVRIATSLGVSTDDLLGLSEKSFTKA